MDAGDYRIAWIIYLVSAVVLSWLCWVVLRKLKVKEIGWLLQCWLLALLFTPWYVLPDDELLAPALMVFAMDLITINAESAIRALIPIVMAMMAGAVLTLLFSVVYRVMRRRRLRRQQSA